MSSSEPASGGVLVMQTFSRASPLSLGVVQIMVGVMVILFGIPMAASRYLLLLVYSGTFVWGALLYITAGALTVAAGKLTNRIMVKTALSLNICAAITSFISAVLLAVDASRVAEVLVKGMFASLVCFQLLMFAASLTVVVFASLATFDCTCDQLPTVFVNPGTASRAAQAPPTSYAPPAPSAQPATLQMQS